MLAALPGKAFAILGDFNGDGRGDLAVGVPDEDIGGVSDAGAVNVIYGSASGLVSAGNQFWHQNSPGILDAAENGDNFGSSLVSAALSFSGSLAIGVPNEDIGSIADAGAVNIINGSAGGLTSTGNRFWHQNSPGISDFAEAGDRFGFSLAGRDIDDNCSEELAIGIPFEDIGRIVDTGAVNTIFNAGDFCEPFEFFSQFLSQNSAGIPDVAEKGDRFGFSLEIGDFVGEGLKDLAIGVPLEDIGGIADAGAVIVVYAVDANPNQIWHQGSPGIPDSPEAGDRFGFSLTAGDFNVGAEDLAIGVPGEDIGSIADAGAVNVIYSDSVFGGLISAGAQFWSQNSIGILDAAENGDNFGRSLTSGRFNGFIFPSGLAVGVPSEGIGSIAGAGAVNVIYGSGGGLSSTGNQLWHQNSSGILDTAETGDSFGESLNKPSR